VIILNMLNKGEGVGGEYKTAEKVTTFE
jgi:hypothetical protein